ncbi:MAG: hypothetical protein H7Y03_06360 [Chitinophagaceae bacterium]|nr:hypothetical protein [Chitinophagaceae bacterium]
MSALEDHIKRINDKLQHLLKKYSFLQKENLRLRQELHFLKKSLEDKTAHANLLEQRIDVLKISKGTMTEEEKKLFEKRIRQYLKEIDKCINFMNE